MVEYLIIKTSAETEDEKFDSIINKRQVKNVVNHALTPGTNLLLGIKQPKFSIDLSDFYKFSVPKE